MMIENDLISRLFCVSLTALTLSTSVFAVKQDENQWGLDDIPEPIQNHIVSYSPKNFDVISKQMNEYARNFLALQFDPERDAVSEWVVHFALRNNALPLPAEVRFECFHSFFGAITNFAFQSVKLLSEGLYSGEAEEEIHQSAFNRFLSGNKTTLQVLSVPDLSLDLEGFESLRDVSTNSNASSIPTTVTCLKMQINPQKINDLMGLVHLERLELSLGFSGTAVDIAPLFTLPLLKTMKISSFDNLLAANFDALTKKNWKATSKLEALTFLVWDGLDLDKYVIQKMGAVLKPSFFREISGISTLQHIGFENLNRKHFHAKEILSLESIQALSSFKSLDLKAIRLPEKGLETLLFSTTLESVGLFFNHANPSQRAVSVLADNRSLKTVELQLKNLSGDIGFYRTLATHPTITHVSFDGISGIGATPFSDEVLEALGNSTTLKELTLASYFVPSNRLQLLDPLVNRDVVKFTGRFQQLRY